MTVFIIDQYPEEEPEVVKLKDGSSAVTNRELTIQFIYNANYWMINVGGLAGIVTTLIEKHAGFGYAYLISLCLMVAAAVLFQAGFSHFITAPPTGNVITSVFEALRRRRQSHENETTHQGREEQDSAQQDRAAILSEDEKLLSETKAALKACLLFLPFPALMLCIDIMDSGLVAQAGSMQTHGLPNDIMYNLNPIACLPGNIPNDVNIGIQTPTYVFLALGEILAIVAGTELAYTRAPENMKSIVQALFLLFSALGAVIGVGVSFAAEDPNMVIVYGCIAGLLAFVTIAFEFAVIQKVF
ncbi:hypothetical protein E8E13_006343 [Curvularia kusanoi]|uniref:Oligopeptide transporter n=1 Tax=Curvularia kusanoi TaxID=90978 RepID=A0A9P4W8D6_CURKU|nr:hypothetical protein E8E13_006343 [Curvularia kusanoi]